MAHKRQTSDEKLLKTDEITSETKGVKSMKTNNKTMYVIFISLVIDLLAFTVILPLLPSLLDLYNREHKLEWWMWGVRSLTKVSDDPRWNSVLFGGLVGSMFSLLQFLSTPILGSLSDVHGRKPLLLLSSVGVSLSYLLWCCSYTFPVFLLSRLLGGLSKGNISLSMVIVGDVTDEKNRSKGMATIGIAFSVGFLIGPLVGAWFASFSKDTEYFFIYPAIYALSLSVINILFIMFFFEETLPPKKRSLHLDTTNITTLLNPIHLLTSTSNKDKPNLKLLNLTYFCFLFIFSGLEFTLTFLTHLSFNYNSMQQGKMFFFTGLVMILFNGTVTRRVKKGSEIGAVKKAIIVLALSFLLIASSSSSSSSFLFYAGMVLFAYASSTVVPCLTSHISMLGGDEEKGKLMGIFRSSGSLARALGPICASILFWSSSPMICYCVGGASLVLPYVLLCI